MNQLQNIKLSNFFLQFSCNFLVVESFVFYLTAQPFFENKGRDICKNLTFRLKGHNFVVKTSCYPSDEVWQ
jgi:hypothetical protein